MFLAYLDDSRDPQTCVVCALLVPADGWKSLFGAIKAFRSDLKASDGLFTRKEWHATEFVSGHGRIADRVISKGRRAQIFGDALSLLGGFKSSNVWLIAAVLPRKLELRAYERVLNRINKTMETWSDTALMIWDQGKDKEYRRLSRKMAVYNYIPSKYGQWAETGRLTKNIPLDFILEDPIFKDSAESYFLQMVDFCAYALLRRESPLASKTKYGYDTVFAKVAPILFPGANTKDPEGIIRP
jgi:hypothetical protein